MLQARSMTLSRPTKRARYLIDLKYGTHPSMVVGSMSLRTKWVQWLDRACTVNASPPSKRYNLKSKHGQKQQTKSSAPSIGGFQSMTPDKKLKRHYPKIKYGWSTSRVFCRCWYRLEVPKWLCLLMLCLVASYSSKLCDNDWCSWWLYTKVALADSQISSSAELQRAATQPLNQSMVLTPTNLSWW